MLRGRSAKKSRWQPPPPLTVYFGTDTTKDVSKGIYQSRFDTTHGQLTPPVLAAATRRPSFLAVTPAGQARALCTPSTLSTTLRQR